MGALYVYLTTWDQISSKNAKKIIIQIEFIYYVENPHTVPSLLQVSIHVFMSIITDSM